MDPPPLPGGRRSCKNTWLMPISQLYYELTSWKAPEFISCPKTFHESPVMDESSAYTEVSLVLPPSHVIYQALSGKYIYFFLTEFSETARVFYILLCRALSRIQAKKSQNKPTKQNNFLLILLTEAVGLPKLERHSPQISDWGTLTFNQERKKKSASERGQPNPEIQE